MNKSNGIFPAHPFLFHSTGPSAKQSRRSHQHSILLSLRLPGYEFFNSEGRNWHKKNYYQRTPFLLAQGLSSTSRQQRKLMLPKPRPSSRISAKCATLGDTTSRIARRVPSLLLAMPCNNSKSITTQVVVRAAADCNLLLPEAGLRSSGSPLRISWSIAGQTCTSPDLCPTPD